jgi:hypothetical protein
MGVKESTNQSTNLERIGRWKTKKTCLFKASRNFTLSCFSGLGGRRLWITATIGNIGWGQRLTASFVL